MSRKPASARASSGLPEGVAWVRGLLEAYVARTLAAGPVAARRLRRQSDDERTAPVRPAIDTLDRLCGRLGLNAFEADILLLCAAAALDSSVPPLCAAASGDPAKRAPSFALALRIFSPASWDALAPSGALRLWRLVEIHQSTSEPLVGAALRADERVVNYLLGLNEADDRVDVWTGDISAAPGAALPPSHEAHAEAIAATVGGVPRDRPAIVEMPGAAAASKRAVAAGAAQRLDLRLWRLPWSALAALGAEAEGFARLLLREARLLDVALYLDCDDADGASEPQGAATLLRFLDRLEGMIVFLAVREAPAGLDVACSAVVEKPTTAEQRAAWLAVMRLQHPGVADVLAGQFNLDITTIESVAARAGGAKEEARDAERRLWRGAREAARPRITGLAERIDVRATWDDLVLPAAQEALLRELAAQVRNQWTVYEKWGFGRRLNRGLGIGALFAGDSGTGKTMAAEVIAGDADLDLYRIDLASVVSKYVGETEKNLRRVFDAFDDGAAILFFDEADALFGKRSEIKDSHDRYANIEVNYLLQRMESYRGLAILATNRRGALDTAFLRRLRFIVGLPYPQVAERAQIWRKAFPKETPVAGLDIDRLARLCLSGGNIQSVALNAAFRAAAERRNVGMDLILASARAEMIKLELPVNESDFRLDEAERRRA